MRLIDADEIIKETWGVVIKDMFHMDETVEVISRKDIDNAPTIDAEPVRHGHWEWNDYGGFGNYHCTVCRHIPYGKFSRMHRLNYMYCPYCGAKMDEEKENDTN